MSDPAIKNAIEVRDRLAKRINELQQELNEKRLALNSTEKFIQEWHRYAGSEQVVDGEPFRLTGEPDVDAERVQNLGKNPDRKIVGDAVEQILDERREPVQRRELFQTLADRRIVIMGKDPEMVLSTMLWRMPDRFVRLSKYGYWHKDRPYEPAGYNPLATAMNTPLVERRP